MNFGGAAILAKKLLIKTAQQWFIYPCTNMVVSAKIFCETELEAAVVHLNIYLNFAAFKFINSLTFQFLK